MLCWFPFFFTVYCFAKVHLLVLLRLALPVTSMFSAPTDFCKNLTYGRTARKNSSKITMKMHMFYVKHPRTLKISDRHIINAYNVIFCSFSMIKYLEYLFLEFCCVFPKKKKNKLTIFPDLVHQPDLISAVLFVRKME